jgi:oligopeptide/dipeptide ABC transporter ATP-binding protein
MVFQNPNETLNPSHTVGGQIIRVIRKFGVAKNDEEVHKRVDELLDLVKLPRAFKYRKPRQLSGGQKQRIGIARALMVRPDFIMADEVVSALDVSVQAQVLNLFAKLQREMQLTMLFITHDLAVVGHVSDHVAVMYLGRIVEIAPTRALFSEPHHPYTEALLSAAPTPEARDRKKRIVLEGDIPSAVNPPSGCPFRTRCPYALGACAEGVPVLREVGPSHRAACIRDDLTLAAATGT